MRAIDADAMIERLKEWDTEDKTDKALYNFTLNRINEQPTIQPDNNLQKLADEIASFKRHVKSENSDYLTGYLCALSVVEGMIADMRGEQNG